MNFQKIKVFFLLTLCFVLLSLQLRSQNQVAKQTPAGTWYYEYLPADYNGNSDDYPVMFFLHGLGERGNNESDLPKVAKNGPPKLVKNGTDFPFILISPQLKTNLDWPPNYVDEVVEHILQGSLRVDPNRVYVTGLSLGGGGAWFYAQSFPEKIAALAPICGSRNNKNKACNIAAENIPVWAFHGDNDPTINYKKTTLMIEAINECTPAINPAPKLTIYEGVSHNSWSRAYKNDNSLHTPNIYQWFMMQSRSSISVSAGTDKTINLPTNTVNLTATVNSSATVTTRTWVKVSGPSGALANANTNTLTVANMVAGIYTFRFSATDADGGSASDEVKVTVVNSNSSPTANAGADKQIQLPTNSATINGSGSDTDGTITSYAWAKVSGVPASLTNATTPNLTVAGLVAGIYVYELTVTDNNGATASDQMTIEVLDAANSTPTADAGSDKNIQLPLNTVNLTGSGSDPDGTIATYLWEKLSGGSATITNANKATATVSNLSTGIYEFKLTVNDDDDASASDRVKVTVSNANQAPNINITTSVINITLPTSAATLSASANDVDGSIDTKLWEQQSGPVTGVIVNASNFNTTVNSLTTVGNYTFSFTVVDNQGSSASEVVTINVLEEDINEFPTANAGEDKFLTLPDNSIVLNGTATDSDGTISEVRWSKVAGPAVNLSGQTTNQLALTDMLEGSYRFRFTATDNDSDQSSDIVEVIVAPEEVNAAPIVSVGSDIEISLPTNTANITATASDTDGTIASYLWNQLAGPSGITIQGANTQTLALSALVAGTYQFSVTVTDNDGAQSSDQINVTVFAQNIAPSVNAGNDLTITLPIDLAEIMGIVSDADGTVEMNSWSQISGPSTASIIYPDSSLLRVESLVQGNYVFKLTAVDDDGLTASDNVRITVNEDDNQSPAVDAGSDKTIQLPTNSLNLQATATDTDGTINFRQWEQKSGPNTATLTNANTRTVTIDGLVAGIYTFEFSARDDDDALGIDEVKVTVEPEEQNQKPIVSVTSAQTINLPTNSATINSTATDNDGSIATYSWSKTGGPEATLTNNNSAVLTVTNLVAGSYDFKLTVTDDDGATASATAQVFVLPEDVNQSPTANAGSNKLIILPQAITTVVGSGVDNDGTIVAYLWEKVSGPNITLQNITNSTLTLTNLVEGVAVLKLTVTDDDGAISSDEMTLTISVEAVNIPPNANAGPDLSTILPINTLSINGSGIDQDGVIATYKWIKVSGPSVSLSNTANPTLLTSSLIEGSYVFQLTVTDNDDASNSDRVNVSVFSAQTNQEPIVNAGADKTIILPTNTLTINGTANDPDGTIASVIWVKISGGAAVLTNQTTRNLNLSGLVAGNYTFRLSAEDDDGTSASDEVSVRVLAENANQAPTVSAGQDKTVQLPTNSINLTAVANDPESASLTTLWSKVSGPTVSISNQNTLTVSLSNLLEGMYTFRFTATDPDGLKGEDQVSVEVLSTDISAPPVVDAGPLITLQLPENETILTGNAMSAGSIVSLSWEQLSGPEVAILSGSTTTQLSVKALIEGTYVFRLTAIDNLGQSAFDDVNVIVYPVEEVIIPELPILDLANEILVQLPEQMVMVNAEATSPDGLITNYDWQQLTGPTELTIAPDSAAVVEVTNFVKGAYYVKLTVFDANDSSVSKTTRITVLEETEIARPRRIFTPNNDGIDDVWKIEGAENLSLCDIKVIDSQGRTVFKSTGYSNAWDGTGSSGQMLPKGIYFYTISCPDNSNVLNGAVTIIR